MIIEEANIDRLPVNEQRLIKALLKDVDTINSMIRGKIYIDWQDYHDEYSPERVDPCPDYYGYYRVYLDTLNNPDILNNYLLGVEMNVRELDTCLCLLYDFIENA